jgi:hypothetical protein
LGMSREESLTMDSPSEQPGRLRRWRDSVRQRLSFPRLTRWRLVAIGGIAAILFVWSGVAVSSTTMYSATVLVTGEGGIGLPPPTDTLDFGDVSPGFNMSRKLTLTNDGHFDSYVAIIVTGGIRDFLSVDDAFFVLDKGEERTVEFKVRPPANAGEKRYSGRVFIVRMPWTPW